MFSLCRGKAGIECIGQLENSLPTLPLWRATVLSLRRSRKVHRAPEKRSPCQKYVFLGKSSCEFGAREVNHLQSALEKGYWADGRGCVGGNRDTCPVTRTTYRDLNSVPAEFCG